MSAIDKVAPIKERRVKQNSQKWFVAETADEIKLLTIALNINNTVVHDDNSVLEGFKNYNSTSVENLKNAPKALNKSSINILIWYLFPKTRF